MTMSIKQKEDKPKMYTRKDGIPYFVADFVSYPLEGGTLSYLEGCSRPYKGLPDVNVLYVLDTLKRIIRLFLKFIGKNLFLAPFVLFGWRSVIKSFNEISEVSLRRFYIILERYCVSARELIRVGDKVFKNLDLLEVFMVVVTFYEYDMAYRFRSQFALSLINKDSFKASPYQELKRILAEINKRENDESVRGKYKIFEKLIWVFKIPKIKKFSIAFVEEMDMVKITPDGDDRWWMTINKGEFNFF